MGRHSSNITALTVRYGKKSFHVPLLKLDVPAFQGVVQQNIIVLITVTIK